MNELAALLIVAEHSGKSIDEMLAAAEKAGFPDRAENEDRFLSLLQQNYIEGAFVLDQPVTVTLAGKDRLRQLKAAAEYKVRQSQEKWIDRLWGFIAGAASTVVAQLIVSAIAGLQ